MSIRRLAPFLLLVLALFPDRDGWSQEPLRVDSSLAGTALPAPEVPGDYAAAALAARDKFRRILLEEGAAGISVAAAVDGQIVWSEGFGWADVEQRVPMTPQTKMRVGSVSKAITGVALGLLHERGELELDAEIQRYVPDFPLKAHPITVEQVAGHLAGIRHYRGREFLLAQHYSTVRAALEVFQDDPLLFEPGSRYSYSSWGWNLLSAVVEGASDQEFLDFMETEIFDRLAMRDSGADQNSDIVPRRTRFYVRREGKLSNAPYVDNSVKWAGGGFLSTAEDLVRFGSGLLDERVVSGKTLEALWQPLRTSDGESTGYGIGWQTFEYSEPGDEEPGWIATYVERDALDGLRFVGHGGGSIGGVTAFLVQPESRVVLAAISNTSMEGPQGAKLFLTLAALGGELAAAQPRRAASAPGGD